MRHFAEAVAAVVVSVLAVAANAGPLTGQTLEVTGSLVAPPSSALVGPGVEFNYAFGDLDFDFDEDGLLDITYVRGAGSHGFGGGDFDIVFSDLLGTIDEIIGFNLLSVDAGITGITQADLSFTADSIRVYMDETTWRYIDSDPTASMQILFSSRVPVPGTLMLCGIGLLGLTCSRKRMSANWEVPTIRHRMAIQ